jgi:hypothetical protein
VNNTLSADEFRRGLMTIRSEIDSAVRERKFRSVSVSYTSQGSGPNDTTFSVTADGQTAQQVFFRSEIDDSAERIDAYELQSKSILIILFVAATISRDGFVDEPKALISQPDND